MNELSSLIEDSATKLFEGFIAGDGNEKMEAGIFPEALWADFVADGWLRTLLSEENDGTGLGLAGGCLLMKLAGYYTVPLPVVESLLATYLLAEARLPVTDELYVPAIIEEPLSKDGELRLKSVPWARHAAGLLVIFPTEKQTQIVLIPQKDYQISEGRNMAGEPRDIVRIDISLLQNKVKLSGIVLEQINSWLALGRAAQIAGAMQSVLERTVEFANERVQFGRQIGKFQAVQQQLAVQAELTNASICAVDAAIAHLGTEQEWELIACAKVTTSESAGIAAKTAHAVHAAIGFTQEYPLQLSTRRLWSWRDEYGNEAEWSTKLGTYCMRLETDDLWNWLTKQTA